MARRNYSGRLSRAPSGLILIGGAGRGLIAYREAMGRTILTVLGVLLAIWLAFTLIGVIFAAIKLFFIVGVIAAIVVGVVTLISRSGRR